MLPAETQVLIVGSGPAGLAAALELKKLGVEDLLVVEREAQAGGIPRLCGHLGFGLRDLHRLTSGPEYARHYRQAAQTAGVPVYTSTTLTHWIGQQASFTSPRGIEIVAAQAVLLATGVRERPRAARLIPGHRPQGVFTTGSLQRLVYEQQLPVGRRAVIIGAEAVSLSALLTLRHANVQTAAFITDLPRHQLYPPVFLTAKVLFADLIGRTPVHTNRQVVSILGRRRVEGIQVSQPGTTDSQTIACDTVVFSGDWIPENELARSANLQSAGPAHGPQVDSHFRTSREGIFAAGNLLRGAETADWAALEGRQAARAISAWLSRPAWPTQRIEVNVQPPLDWICPSLLSPDSLPERFRVRSHSFCDNASLAVHQNGRLLHSGRLPPVLANTSLELSAGWAASVDFDAGPVRVELLSNRA